MNTSPTDRTPGFGRHANLSAGIAFASATNFVCRVSRSSMNCLRTSAASALLGTLWALEVLDICAPASAGTTLAATTRAEWNRREVSIGEGAKGEQRIRTTIATLDPIRRQNRCP